MKRFVYAYILLVVLVLLPLSHSLQTSSSTHYQLPQQFHNRRSQKLLVYVRRRGGSSSGSGSGSVGTNGFGAARTDTTHARGGVRKSSSPPIVKRQTNFLHAFLFMTLFLGVVLL
uniref:Transmembrane protein n=1 Tax=Cannabis sativa TaxID=3483 RepID=A0A803R7W1_CANSA